MTERLGSISSHLSSNMMGKASVFEIAPNAQSYDWGTVGGASTCAQFAQASVHDFELDHRKPYAEVRRVYKAA